MLSGIGPADHLGEERPGPGRIDVRVELERVGTNLQDRYEVGIVTKVTKPFGSTEACTFADPALGIAEECDEARCVPDGVERDPCLVDWTKGKGVYLSNGGILAIARRSTQSWTAGGKDADLFIFGLPGYFRGYEAGYSKKVSSTAKDHFSWLCLKGHTRNRAGTVRLRTNDPRDLPAINFRNFDDRKATADARADLDAVVEGVEHIRAILEKSEKLDRLNLIDGKWGLAEVYPGTAAPRADRAKTAEWVRENAWGHHASCTCPMGKSPGDSVLDGKFRVHKTARLRVVDASVFPRIPGFFIVAPIYMISEKASDVIAEAASGE
jgi:choline dehydrogenase